jgi:hypothetical protein
VSPGAQLRAKGGRVEIWRIFRVHMTELSPRLVDRHERELHFHRCNRPEPANSCSCMWEEEIVRIEEYQDGTC